MVLGPRAVNCMVRAHKMARTRCKCIRCKRQSYTCAGGVWPVEAAAQAQPRVQGRLEAARHRQPRLQGGRRGRGRQLGRGLWTGWPYHTRARARQQDGDGLGHLVHGCGPSPPAIAPPSPQGPWTQRLIPNPDFYEDEAPITSSVAPIGGVALELWTIDSGYMFDNLIITRDPQLAALALEQLWKPRHEQEVRRGVRRYSP